MYSNEQLSALRKAYKKNLWFNLSAVLASLLFAGYMLLGELIAFPLIGGLAAGLGVIAAIANYAIEHALYRKGKNAFFVLILCMILPPLIFVVAGKAAGLQGSNSTSFLPYLASFIFLYAAIPLVQLLRDGTHLREGNPCETVGRMKKNTRRREASVGRENYLLFEDELTHEVHLLRTGSLSPLHRYRVWYLPHSRLAVGEPIPDDVAFDPFGNPIERKVPEADGVETPYDTEETPVAETPSVESCDYIDDEPYTEATDERRSEAWQEDTATSHRPLPDPNSPERQKAKKMAMYHKICQGLTFVCFGLVFVGAILTKTADTSPLILLFFLPLFAVALLSSYFKNQELKLRCTERTTAICVNTVRRRSGKSSHLYPVVEYEVEGVRRTAELSISCTRNSVGELYTIYYDPLDPTTVRAE